MSITDNDGDLLAMARGLASNDYSSLGLVEHYLRRITRLDGKLNSYTNVMTERALAEARRADLSRSQGRVLGPLHGIPFAVKDVYDAEGEATTAGSPAFKNRVATRDATAVARLRGAGAILLGKLATHELTHGGVDLGLPWPPARNPWNLDYDPGGSSSGPGVAVASGLCAFALGTDTGGSIRKPAGMCGISGLKPTFGRVSRFGVMLNAASLDHCGPMARSASDCGVVLQAIAGRDTLDSVSASESVPDYIASVGKGIGGLRIGVVTHFWTEDLACLPAVREAMGQAIETLKQIGAKVSDLRLKSIAEYTEPKMTIQRFELFAAYGGDIRSRRAQFGPKMRNRMDDYARITEGAYRAAKQRQAELTAEMLRSMAGTDVLITAGPGPAELLADVAARIRAPAGDLTLPFNLTGFPAAVTCIGFTENDLPLSMQVVGRPFDEATVLQVANAYERATRWHLRHPFAEQKKNYEAASV
jgi:aspartyl-tRNA(Asn)/glutamyl-tRNA(Gln) amidotransferase subunit A